MQELEKILEEIEQAKREPWYRLSNYDVKHKLDGAINRIADIISKHMNDGWIPVEERLPDEYEEGTDIYDKNTLAVMDTEYHMVSNLVNVTVYDTESEKYFVGDDCTFDGEWCNFGLVTGNYEVIAWRPLPEPYRPERQKEGAQQNES